MAYPAALGTTLGVLQITFLSGEQNGQMLACGLLHASDGHVDVPQQLTRRLQ
jgi:hypothetical protein